MWIWIILGFIAIVLVFTNIRVVPQAKAYVIERLGAYNGTWETGLHVKIPLIDKIASVVSLKERVADFAPQLGMYQPVGDTDSEAAFCDMLNRLRAACSSECGIEQLLPVIVAACNEYRSKGVFNCLLSNGDWLFSYCTTKLAHITRRAPFGPATLKDADMSVDFQSETTPNDVVTVLATEPLTDNELWTLYAPGEWRLWRNGETIAQGC